MNVSGPVLRPGNLGRAQFVALLRKLVGAWNSGKSDAIYLPDEAFEAFMRHFEQRIGEATFRTPRTTITAFIGLLAVLEQNPGTEWQVLLQQKQNVLDQYFEEKPIPVRIELVSLSL